jgi:hypothetical protein
MPHLLALGARGSHHAAEQLFVVRERARIDVAQRDHDRASQGSRVDEVRAAEALGISDRVDQNQPSFGIGIQYFDGLSVERFHDIAGPLRLAPDHVLDGRHQRRHRDRRL